MEFAHATELANKKIALAKTVHDNDSYLAGDDDQKRQEADAKYTNAVKAHQDELNAALMNFNKQRAQAVATANDEIKKLNQKALELLDSSEH